MILFTKYINQKKKEKKREKIGGRGGGSGVGGRGRYTDRRTVRNKFALQLLRSWGA